MVRKVEPRPAHCRRCGEELAGVGQIIDHKGRMLWAGRCPECDAGHCPQCGRHIPNGVDRFCNECGTALGLKG